MHSAFLRKDTLAGGNLAGAARIQARGSAQRPPEGFEYCLCLVVTVAARQDPGVQVAARLLGKAFQKMREQGGWNPAHGTGGPGCIDDCIRAPG